MKLKILCEISTSLATSKLWFRRICNWLVLPVFLLTLTLVGLQPAQTAPALSTTNLILNADATSSSSYGGSGNTWTDLSSSGNHLTSGTGCGTTSGPSWSSTEGGGSFLFNTDKQCLKRDTLSSAPKNFSLFFWIKPTSLPSTGTFSYLAQISRNASISNQEYMFGFNSSGQLYFWDFDSGYGYNHTSGIANTLVTTNTWQYVGFVKNGTNATFYIGKAGSIGSVGTAVASKDANYGTSSFVIGYDFRDNNNSYKGYLGAVHYYSSALSSATITDNFNATPRLLRQTISISSLGTSSKNYPYSQSLSISTSGSSGLGLKSYSVTNGTATGCALSDTGSATSTISASSSGTCNVTVSIDADASYTSASSSAAEFTFNKASQSPLSITTTSARYGETLILSSSGGSTGVTPTYSVTSGSCTISGSVLTPTGVGSCIITANLATDYRYLATSSGSTTISIASGVSSATINFTPGLMIYRQEKIISATTSSSGKVTFRSNGNRITRCKNISVNSLNSYTATCNYKPPTHGYVTLSATFDPSDPLISGTFTSTGRYWVERRTVPR